MTIGTTRALQLAAILIVVGTHFRQSVPEEYHPWLAVALAVGQAIQADFAHKSDPPNTLR